MKLKNKSIIEVLKTTNMYLWVIVSFAFFIALGASGFILYQSHLTLCGLYDSKMQNIKSSLARELSLEEMEVAQFLFGKLVKDINAHATHVNLKLSPGAIKSEATSACEARLDRIVVAENIEFSGEVIGNVSGEVSFFKLSDYIALVIISLGFIIISLVYVRRKLVSLVQRELVEPLGKLYTGEYHDLSQAPVEVLELSKKLEEMKHAMLLKEKSKLELEHVQKISAIIKKVVHDLRSPIEVLKLLQTELSGLPQDSSRRLQMSIKRIEEVGQEVLKKDQNKNSSASCEVLSSILEVIESKKIEFSLLYRLNLNLDVKDLGPGELIGLDSNRFKSIISNLINNAADSIGLGSGEIQISLLKEDHFLKIIIQDNGAGVSPEVAKNIFKQGQTTKIEGNGIGLSSAKSILTECGGDISFESEFSDGARFILSIPLIGFDFHYLRSISLVKYKKIIILSTDNSFIESIDFENKEIFNSLDSFKNEVLGVKEDEFLICDLNIFDDLNRKDLMTKISGIKNSILVFDHLSDVQGLSSDLKLVHKASWSYLDFKNTNPKVVLIDNDNLVHMNWKKYCEQNDLEIIGFTSVDGFISEIGQVHPQSIICVDSELGEGERGELRAKEIYEKGFKDIYLSTGYSPDVIDKTPWIKEIISKDPNNLKDL